MMERTDPSPVSAPPFSERASAPAGAGEQPGDDRLRAMLDATPQLMWLVDPDGTLVEVNRAALAFGGLRREDVVGESFWEGPWWEGSEEAQDRLKEAIRRAAQGTLVRYETDALGTGGRIDTLDFAIQPVRDGTEHALLHAEGRLITEAVQTRRLQEGLVAARIGTWEIDLGTEAVHRSASSDLVFGFEPDGRPRDLSEYLARIHPDDLPDALETIRRAVEEQSEQFVEFRVLHPDGSVRWAAARGTAALDERGEPDHLVGAIMDVTEQRASEQAHREQEVRLALALDAGQFATWDWFVLEDRVAWSDQMYLLYGYDIGAVEPSYALWASHIHPDDRPGVEQALRRAMEGDERYVVAFRILPAGGGAERWIEARGRFHYDEDGTPYHLTGVVGDVTERVQTDTALREQAQALTTLNRINTALAGELDLDELVQAATDAATALAAAQFGAFFYNVHDEAGESYTLYTLSGVPREKFEQFPMPRNTRVFGPTFRGEGIVRSDDITQDPRYGQNAPYHGMPEGHLPVRSYLAVPVVSRSGAVHGGLFLGHEQPGVFTEQAEHLVAGIAAQAAVAIDNARLYEAAQRELAERKEAEAALLASEEQFRHLVLSLPAAVYTTDREGRVTLFNEEAVALWGRRPKVGEDLWCGSWRIYHPDGTPLPLDECPMAVALREERSVRGQEVIVERPDGTRSHVLPHPEPLRDASGEVVGAVNMLMDITELKRADRDRALLAAIVESSDDAIVSKTLDGIITSWNAGAEQILGYTAAEAIGQSVLMLIPPDRRDEEDLILGRIRRGERIEHFETIRITKDGRALDVSLTISPVRGSDGLIVGASKVLRDITASKRAEAALRESEAQFRVALKHAPVIMQRLDRELRYEWVYNAHQDTPSDIIGMRAGTSRPPEEAAPYVDLLQKVLETGEGTRRELTFDMPSGRVVTDLTVEPMRDEEGEIVGIITAAYDVTEIRQAETALRESEARFRTLADSAPVLVWMSDEQNRGTYFNRQWLEFTGRTVEQELGFGWAEAVHPDDLAGAVAYCQRHFDAREEFQMEFRLRRADGEYRWVLDRGIPRYASDGSFVGYIGSCIDIHDRKRAEMRAQFLADAGTLLTEDLDFRATLQRVAQLAVPGFADWCTVKLVVSDGLHDLAVAHVDPEKVRWGEELQRRYPADPDAPVGVPNVLRTGQSELYPDIPDEMLVQAARSEEELAVLREVGFRSAVIVPLQAGGDVIGAITFVASESGRRFDEGDLQVAEELGRRAGAAIENARLHEALRASEARFRHLAEALPDIAYVLPGDRTDRDTEYLNPQWYAYTGLPEGMSYAQAAPGLVHPDDIPRVREAWAEAAAAMEPMELEIRLRRHDGAYRWFLTRVVPVLDADGRVARWFGTSTDIHAQKAAEAELAERVAERTAELARSNEALDQFAYVASHDLKAPLRAIDNLAAWIAQDTGPALPEESRRHLGLLQGRVRRMEQLLSDLLAYSRTGREEGTPEEVDAAALVREVVEMIAPPPEVEIVVEALPTLVTPRPPLAMVFRNLIDNAVKHREGASARVRVSADVSATGDFVTFSVEDDGPGIPARYHERIFGLFQTLQPRDEIEGSGMGLAVVKKAVESYGGSIRVDSVLGQGATFTFTWPARASDGVSRR